MPFVITFRSARKKLHVTVFFDHPVMMAGQRHAAGGRTVFVPVFVSVFLFGYVFVFVSVFVSVFRESDGNGGWFRLRGAELDTTGDTTKQIATTAT